MESDILTIKDVAGYLKVNERTIYRLANKRDIPAFKVGNMWQRTGGLNGISAGIISKRTVVYKKSGIVNDANDWAIETMKNPKYPLELFLRVITVSLDAMRIVKSLPQLDID